MKMIKATEVQQHNSRDSCWVIISNNVYDVTDFLGHHPGGANSILRFAGKDATEEYEPVHPPGTIEQHLPKDKHLGPVSQDVLQGYLQATSSDCYNSSTIPPTQSPLSTLQNLDDFERGAQKILPKKAWIYYSSAADSSSAHTNNLAAFSKISLRPRILRNVAKVNLRRKIMGHDSSFPIFIAPAAQAKLGHEDGELCLTRAASRWDALYTASTYSSIGHVDLANCLANEQQSGGKGALAFQLYVPKTNKRAGAEALIQTARRKNFKALVVTVDSAVIGKREDDERYKAQLDHDAGLTTHRTTNPDPNVQDAVLRGAHSSTLEWSDLHWIREAWGNSGPLVLKGIQTVEDAVQAAEAGIDAIYLSNHGGRQLDHAPSSLHTLLEIRTYRPEIFDKLDVYVDGGFRRGTDVIKALCLGAKAVGLGRPFMYALTGYGTAGVERAIEIISDEIQTSMRLMGVTDVDQLNLSHVNTSLLELEMPKTVDLQRKHRVSKL